MNGWRNADSLLWGHFFTLILKARKKPVRDQEEILKDLLVIFDRGVKGMYGNTLTTYASKFKNCDPDLDTEFVLKTVV